MCVIQRGSRVYRACKKALKGWRRSGGEESWSWMNLARAAFLDFFINILFYLKNASSFHVFLRQGIRSLSVFFIMLICVRLEKNSEKYHAPNIADLMNSVQQKVL